MEFYIGKIFNLNEYSNAYNWLVAQNNEYYTIKETDLTDDERKFILADETPTQEDLDLQEKERIAKLYLTGADVERGIYQAKGMDFDDIIAIVTQLQPEGLDIKALKIELKANHFYRGNSYVEKIGELLGFTSKQLDYFFEHKEFPDDKEGGLDE